MRRCVRARVVCVTHQDYAKTIQGIFFIFDMWVRDGERKAKLNFENDPGSGSGFIPDKVILRLPTLKNN